MERIVENDQNEIMNGERLADNYSSYLSNAVSEGGSAGARDGDSLGGAEAKARFYAAIDTNVMPSTNYNIPAASYPGVPGASSRFIGGIPTVNDVLQDNNRYGRLRIYQTYDHDYMGQGHREFATRDVWSNDGVYAYHAQNYLDGDAALQAWLKMPMRSRQKYDQLNATVSMNETNSDGRYPAQDTNPGGRPQRPGGPGNPGGGNRPTPPTNPTTPPTTPTPPVTPNIPPSIPNAPTTPPPVVVDYQAIFRDAFTKAYANYAPFSYNRNFYMNLDDGQRDGEATGVDVGRTIAQRKGLARAFDRNYMDTSRNSYLSNFATSYTKSFSTIYNYYKNNSILTLSFIDIIGDDDDGIIQPGEDFKARFKVVNVGGLAANLNYSVSGNVEDAKKLTDSVGAISSKIITSAPIAAIDSSLENGSDANLVLDVNDMHEKLWKKIQRPVQIADLSSTLSSLDGSGLFTVIINNISTVTTNGKISLELKLNGKSVKTVFGDPLKAGEKRSFALDFGGLDPMSWINGNIAVEILLKYNDAVYGSKAFSLTEGANTTVLAQYYDRLLNGNGVVPAGKTADDRTVEVRNILINQNIAEVARLKNDGGNPYRNNPEQTVPGKIAIVKDSRNPQSSKALADYASLADVFNKESKNFGSFLGIHPKRSGYQEVLSRIAGKTIK